MNRLQKAIKNPHLIGQYIFFGRTIWNWIPDKPYLKIVYWCCTGHRLNLKNPKRYNEKLQFLKLYDRNPYYTRIVDKYEAKQVIAALVGDQYIIPTLGVWNSFDEIDFDKLPSQFVLKTTHGCGGVVICKDKRAFDINAARSVINESLKKNYYWLGREWPYKNVVPRIIAEQYMEDEHTRELRDYKFFVFDGEPQYLFVASDRQKNNEETKFDFFDMNYNKLDLKNGHPNALETPEKPKNFELMKELSRKLSIGIPHLRVDLYEVNGKVFVGELTLFHWSGFFNFEPDRWDYEFGKKLNLSSFIQR